MASGAHDSCGAALELASGRRQHVTARCVVTATVATHNRQKKTEQWQRQRLATPFKISKDQNANEKQTASVFTSLTWVNCKHLHKASEQSILVRAALPLRPWWRRRRRRTKQDSIYRLAANNNNILQLHRSVFASLNRVAPVIGSVRACISHHNIWAGLFLTKWNYKFTCMPLRPNSLYAKT